CLSCCWLPRCCFRAAAAGHEGQMKRDAKETDSSLYEGRGLGRFSTILRYSVALIAVLVALAPVYWLITISLKSEVDQFAYPPQWIGFPATMEHYKDAFAGGSFAAYFANSVALAAFSTVAALLIGVPAAYGLARFQWPRGWNDRIG